MRATCSTSASPNSARSRCDVGGKPPGSRCPSPRIRRLGHWCFWSTVGRRKHFWRGVKHRQLASCRRVRVEGGERRPRCAAQGKRGAKRLEVQMQKVASRKRLVHVLTCLVG